ncbi:MAG: cbb3-type cytochrome oxidase assembly protein CcoS [Bacteroidetes bacterium]|nr:cbb3-type cytochrome oxidase assembly protein CcoS [Bacteroidota bacterium]
MKIAFLLIICSISLGALFLGLFIWWVRSGQADDLETPAHRMLFEDTPNTQRNKSN